MPFVLVGRAFRVLAPMSFLVAHRAVGPSLGLTESIALRAIESALLHSGLVLALGDTRCNQCLLGLIVQVGGLKVGVVLAQVDDVHQQLPSEPGAPSSCHQTCDLHHDVVPTTCGSSCPESLPHPGASEGCRHSRQTTGGRIVHAHLAHVPPPDRRRGERNQPLSTC